MPDITKPQGQSLLRRPVKSITEVSAEIPGGCYCPPDRCSAPVIMGRQTPCLRRAASAPEAAQPAGDRCPMCSGAGVVGSPGMPCPGCEMHKLGLEYRRLSEAPADTESLVLRITTAYEQGFGHALRSELSNPYSAGSVEAEAWDHGREVGRRRHVPADTEAQVRENCAVAAWNHFMDVCKSHGLAPADHEKWCAASAIRRLVVGGRQ